MSTTSSDYRADLRHALQFVQDELAAWHRDGLLRPGEFGDLTYYYRRQLDFLDLGKPHDDFALRSPNVCWDCKAVLDPDEFQCPECLAPAHDRNVERLRQLVLLCQEVRKHERSELLSMASAHRCLAEANGRVVALRKRLALERPPEVRPAESSSPKRRERPRPEEPAIPRPSFFEVLLDPKTIQWLLGVGGVLLALGLVIYLIAAGILDSPGFVAALLGGTNVALLVVGWWLTGRTRYGLAGRALTLIACLLLPFNLWFYDAQGLMVLRQGGRLWLPAIACCVLFVISARITRDPLLAYVIVAGVALAGVLILGDPHIDRLAEVAGPVVFLVGLGLCCLHAPQLFADGDGPFSRGRFGLQFFFAGQAVLGAGLLFLLGAQLYGTCLYPAMAPAWQAAHDPPSEIVTTTGGRVTALILLVAATYGYVYSDMAVRKVGVYLYLAVFTFLWAGVVFIGLIDWPIPTVEVALIAMALTALLVNFASVRLDRELLLARSGPAVGLVLAVLPAAIGVLLRITAVPGAGAREYTIGGARHVLGASYVVSMTIVALCSRVGAHLWRRHNPGLTTVYFFAAAAATLAAADGLLLATAPELRWDGQAPLLMLVPILYLIAARLYRGHSPERPLILVALVATAAMLFFSVGIALQGFLLVRGAELNLRLAIFFAEALLFFVLDARLNDRPVSVWGACFSGCAAVWQVLRYAGVEAEDVYLLTLAGVGLAILVAYRAALLERVPGASRRRVLYVCGNAILLLAEGMGALLTLSRFGPADAGEHVLLLPFLLGLCAVAALFLVVEPAWRQCYLAAGITHGAFAVLRFAFFADLTFGQKLELVLVLGGLLLLVAGHVGWYRERERENDGVTTCLTFGSLLVGVPLILTVLGLRLQRAAFDGFYTLNELGLLAGGLLLFGAGYLCRIRATTVAGIMMLVVDVLTLVLYLRLPERLQNVAVYMLVGGGVLFGTGLILSVYRERLKALPGRLRRREGVFRILNWR
jgi:hypothetical protein